jgi:hypothetical protein
MRDFIRNWRINRRIKLLVKAQNAFTNADFAATYYYLAKLVNCTSRELQRSFQVAAMFRRTTTYQLLREALEPNLQS